MFNFCNLKRCRNSRPNIQDLDLFFYLLKFPLRLQERVCTRRCDLNFCPSQSFGLEITHAMEDEDKRFYSA